MKTIKPIIIDGVSHYDEFTTILGGAFTSTPAPVCGRFPEGRVYLVTLSGYVNGWFETATRHFSTYVEAHKFFCKARWFKSLAEAFN